MTTYAIYNDEDTLVCYQQGESPREAVDSARDYYGFDDAEYAIEVSL